MKWIVGLLDLLALLWFIFAGMFAWFTGAIWSGSTIFGAFLTLLIMSPALVWLAYSMAAHYRPDLLTKRNMLSIIALVLGLASLVSSRFSGSTVAW